jgi:hypothetical protein
MFVSDDTYTNGRPVSAFPFASCACAVSGTLLPTLTLALGGVSVIVATLTGDELSERQEASTKSVAAAKVATMSFRVSIRM